MALTLGNWIGIGLILMGGLIIGGLVYYGTESKLSIIIIATVTLGIALGVGIFDNWYNTKTASGLRDYKDYQSELSNGIDREITITAEDGREIFHYEGKVDIESNHEDNYIKFESEEGKRYIIYYGVQDTIIIKEK